MHYTTKQLLRKLAIGAVALAVAAGITLFIKENLDVQDPETALPTIQVTTNGMALSPEMIFRAGYIWNFFTTTEENTPLWTTQDILAHTYPVDVPPRSILSIDFSLKPKTLTVSRTDDENFEYYLDLVDTDGSQIITPAQAGAYLYKIQAGFGRRGSVIYYLLINVKESL